MAAEDVLVALPRVEIGREKPLGPGRPEGARPAHFGAPATLRIAEDARHLGVGAEGITLSDREPLGYPAADLDTRVGDDRPTLVLLGADRHRASTDVTLDDAGERRRLHHSLGHRRALLRRP